MVGLLSFYCAQVTWHGKDLMDGPLVVHWIDLA